MDSPSVRFQRWREARSWSQYEAARELGVSQALVSSIERGDAVVTKIALAKRIQDLSSEWDGGPIRIEEWVPEEHPPSLETTAAAGEGR
jgi:transcriptional regulator with XRE-family HTH domain